MRSRFVSIDDMKAHAERVLPRMVFDFLEGGAQDEITMRANEADFASICLNQRVWVDTQQITLSTVMLDDSVSIPLFISPVGGLTAFRPIGDLAMAAAAHEAGVVFIHSAWSGYPLEEVLEVAPRSWVQIAFWAVEAETARHRDRAKAAGVETLVVAADAGQLGKRERDLRHGLSLPPRPPLRDYLDTALHPGWVARAAIGRKLTWGNVTLDGRPLRISEMTPWMDRHRTTSTTWESLRQLRSKWSGRLVVKGVMCASDATAAADIGADAVIVSNHGGRQLDSLPSTIAALPSIAEAVGQRMEIYLDGGIRRGADIAKAIALGANAVGIGRPAAYGLAVGGQKGIGHVLELLSQEMHNTLSFLGATSIADLGPDILWDSPFRANPELGRRTPHPSPAPNKQRSQR